jgi:hypothetical protein
MNLDTLIHMAAFGTRGLTLENLDDDLPDGGDSDLGSYAEGADAHAAYGDELNLAAEAIRDYAIQLEELVESKQLTPVMLGLIRNAAQQRAAVIGYEIKMAAMESIETQSIEEQAEVALEGFRNVILNIFQDYVLHFKHHKDVISDFFRSTSGILVKYEKKTVQNKAEYNSKKSKIGNQEIRVAFTGLDYFLATDQSEKTAKFSDFQAMLRTDRAVSSFVLKEYPKRVLAEIEALARLLRAANLKTDADVARLAREVEKLKAPAELFDEKLLNTETFGGTKFVITKHGNKHSTQGHGEGAFGRLAELASSKLVVAQGNTRMKIGRTLSAGIQSVGGRYVAGTAAGMAGAAVAGVVAPLIASTTTNAVTAARAIYSGVGDEKGNFMLTGSDIGRVLDAAEGYITDVRYYLSTERDVARAIDAIEEAVKQLEAKGQADSKTDDAQEHQMDSVRVYEQVLAFSRVLLRAMQTPASSEVARALRASKYLNYLALRAIYNAKSGAMEGYDEDAQENIRKMDDAISAHHEHYHKQMVEHADNPKKMEELHRDKANGESQIRQKFMQSHPKPATESAQETPAACDGDAGAQAVDPSKVEGADGSEPVTETPPVEGTVATEGRTAKDPTSEGKITGTGKSQVGKMVACNFAEGPEVVKVVEMHFHEGKTTYLAQKPGKGEFIVGQASGESAEHGCYMHCQEVLQGVQDDVQAKEVFGKKVKAIPAMKKEPKSDKQHATAVQGNATTEGIAEAWGAALEALYVKNTVAPSFKAGQEVTVSVHAVEDGHKHMGTEKGTILACGEGRHDDHYLVKLSTGELCVCGLSESEDKADLVGIHESRIGNLDEENEAKVVKMFQANHK